MNNPLIDKLINKNTKVLTENSFSKQILATTDVPALNVALSARIDGGLTPGLLVVSGLSKTYKTMMCLTMVSSYLKEYEDSICVFYDSEFGVTDEYMSSLGIDPNRVLHVPVEDIEQLKFDIVEKLDKISKGDKVIFFIDSLGNIASRKEVEDAMDAKAVADMSRAKALRSLFRIITPKLSLKELPCLAVAHVYSEIGLFPKTVVGGGTSLIYAANAVWIVTKAQEKSGTELEGFTFTINIDKSRTVKEKSKIPLKVTFDGGLDRYSGLLDLALEFGKIEKPSNGWYQLQGTTEKVREKDTGPLLDECLKDEQFLKFVEEKYKL